MRGFGIVALATLALAAGALFAQPMVVTEDIAVFYNQESRLSAEKLVFGSWGNSPREDPARAFDPKVFMRRGYALHVVSTGRYQGARFDFPKPIDLTPLLNEKNAYLELYLAPVPGVEAPPAAGGPAAPDAPSAPPADDGLPAELRDDNKLEPAPMPRLSNLRFTFFTEKGQGQLVVTPEQFFPKERVTIRGVVWSRIDIPISLVDPKLPIGGKLTRLLITCDVPAEFYLGRLAFVRDVKPLEVKIRYFPPFMEAGKRLHFVADVTAGLARYETTWNFNSAKGNSIDATGDRVSYTYAEEGTYLITCTVRDVSGGKAPISVMIQVKVSPAAP